VDTLLVELIVAAAPGQLGSSTEYACSHCQRVAAGQYACCVSVEDSNSGSGRSSSSSGLQWRWGGGCSTHHAAGRGSLGGQCASCCLRLCRALLGHSKWIPLFVFPTEPTFQWLVQAQTANKSANCGLYGCNYKLEQPACLASLKLLKTTLRAM
jgi:hypothetical protein